MQREELVNLTLAAEKRRGSEEEQQRAFADALVQQCTDRVRSLIDLCGWTASTKEALARHASEGHWKLDLYDSLSEIDAAVTNALAEPHTRFWPPSIFDDAYHRLRGLRIQTHKLFAEHWNAQSDVLATVIATPACGVFFAFSWGPPESALKKAKTL